MSRSLVVSKEFRIMLLRIEPSQTVYWLRFLLKSMSVFHRCVIKFDWACSKVWNRRVDISAGAWAEKLNLRFRWLIFVINPECSNQVDALLDWSHWCETVVDFHRLKWVQLFLADPCLVWLTFSQYGSVKVFTRTLVTDLVRSALHRCEIMFPICRNLFISLYVWQWRRLSSRHSRRHRFLFRLPHREDWLFYFDPMNIIHFDWLLRASSRDDWEMLHWLVRLLHF